MIEIFIQCVNADMKQDNDQSEDDKVQGIEMTRIDGKDAPDRRQYDRQQ